MSERKLDRQNRWRSISVSFRVSPEEGEQLNRLVSLSGMTKRDYIMARLEERAVVVNVTPRVQKALKKQMERIYEELCRLSKAGEVSEEYLDTLRYIASILDGIGEGGERHESKTH